MSGGALATRAASKASGFYSNEEWDLVDARKTYFEQVLRFLIMGNVRRGQLYPLCVGAERAIQAQTLASEARRLGTATVAHGCTAAGNDQVRFEVALRTLAPGLESLAPVRDEAFKRPEQLKFLEDRVDVKAKVATLSAGLKDGSFAAYTGPVVDNTGKERLAKDVKADQDWLDKIDFYVQGVQGKVPTGK